MLPGLVGRRAEKLPAEVTGFVGREIELAQVITMLGFSRLVTLTGTGGVGKTRLALRAATQLPGGYRDGARIVELSAVRDPELLGHAVATALGLERDSRSELDGVLDYLRPRQLLLILDTCEHLVDACALLSETIVREAPGVTLLATSRQPLDVPGELTCHLAPMRVPDAGDTADSDALTLFTQRAAAALPGFTVTPDNRADVIRACQRLEGIPLAIELAAVRLRAMPLRDLVERLDRKLQVLTDGPRVKQNRHQTLRDAIAWSYELCSPEEQALWARLSVFPGTFDIASAEEVCANGQVDRGDITKMIIGLADKSVVLRTGTDGFRYQLLDTIREFGAERLAASGDEAEIRGRHVGRYLAVGRDFAAKFVSDDQLIRVARLRLEDANFQAAIEYSLDGPPGQEGDWERGGAALACSLFPYWQISGRLREGRHLAGKVLDRFPAPSPERASLLLDVAFLDAFQGLWEGVEEAREGTRIAAELGDEWLHARGYLAQNLALTFTGCYDEALPAGEEAQRRLEAYGCRFSLLSLDVQMSMLLTLSGRFDQAYERCQQGLRLLGEHSGEHWLRSYYYALAALALYHLPGKHKECAAFAAKGLPAKFEIGDVVGVGYCLEVFAWLAADAGRFERAAWLFGAADTLWKVAGSRFHNNAIMEESHQQAVKRSRDGLRPRRFDELHARGRVCPLEVIVARAVSGSDLLPKSSAGPAAPAPEPGRLTQREREIADLVGGGMSNREIAEHLVISRRTVEAHVEHIYTKLGICSRVQLVLWLTQQK
jgi:predicted ATPase/DNA-binding CsgD family transcriptional regulator